jgi:cytoskeletal protein CcmA (bactofilin family)
MFFRKRPKETGTHTPGPLRLSVRSDTPPCPTLIGRNTRFRGQIRGRGPVVIRGEVQGMVGIDESFTVEPGGVVDADIRASDVLIGGSVQGDLRAEGTLTVRSTGAVEGKIRARRLRVEEGALLNGAVSRGESGA